MKTLDLIQEQLYKGLFEFTEHAFKRVIERNIAEEEIKQAGKNSQIIEEYPNDKYSPSCLLLGFTTLNRPLHIQVSLMETPIIKIITIYEPDELKWINYSKRR